MFQSTGGQSPALKRPPGTTESNDSLHAEEASYLGAAPGRSRNHTTGTPRLSRSCQNWRIHAQMPKADHEGDDNAE